MTSTSFSQMQRLTTLLGRRDLATIPKNQQALLDRPDSWPAESTSQSNGHLLVPGLVLQTVTEAHAKRKRAGTREHQINERDEDDASSPNSSSEEELPLPRNISEQHETPNRPSPTGRLAGSSPERQVSWSPSPSQSRLHRQAQPESSVVHETPIVVPASSPIKLPRAAPPPQVVPAMSFPSTENDDDDMEMEVPQAHPQNSAAVNRQGGGMQPESTYERSSWVSTNTPTCAQPQQCTVPSSEAQAHSSPPPPAPAPAPAPAMAAQRPFKRHKPYHLEDLHPSSRSTLMTARHVVSDHGFAEVGSSSSTPKPTEPIIPTTISETGAEKPKTTLTQASVLSQVPGIGEVEQPNQEEEAASAPVILASLPQLPEASAKGEVPSAHMNADPFLAFCGAYPEYLTQSKGSLWNFIRACVYLDYLRTSKDLRECLYDDFIRAFSGGFLDYVEQEHASESMSAVNWYNDLDGATLFNRFLVTKQNLPSILHFYPDEVAGLRKIIESDEDKDENTSSMSDEVADVTTRSNPSVSMNEGSTSEEAVKTGGMPRSDGKRIAQITSPTLTSRRGVSRSPGSAGTVQPTPKRASRIEASESRRSLLYPVGNEAADSPRAGAHSPDDRSKHQSFATQPQAILSQMPAPPSPELGMDSSVAVTEVSPPTALPKSRAASKSVDASPQRQQPSLKRPLDRGELLREHFLRKKSNSATSTPASQAKIPRSSPYFRRKSSEYRSSSMRTAEERERLREHFRKRRSSGAESLASSGMGSR